MVISHCLKEFHVVRAEFCHKQVTPVRYPIMKDWISTTASINLICKKVLQIIRSFYGPLSNEYFHHYHNMVFSFLGKLPQTPDNVYVFPWLPVNDVLGHRNCKLFITHAGYNSLIETSYMEFRLLPFLTHLIKLQMLPL